MRDFYYFLLFVLVVILVLLFRRKLDTTIEELTLEEVDAKSTTVLERVGLLETKLDEIKSNQEKQTATMSVAASKAGEAQAFLNQPID
jgi:hypothetical protein